MQGLTSSDLGVHQFEMSEYDELKLRRMYKCGKLSIDYEYEP